MAQPEKEISHYYSGYVTDYIGWKAQKWEATTKALTEEHYSKYPLEQNQTSLGDGKLSTPPAVLEEIQMAERLP